MNICLVSREYPPFVGGGIGTYAETFARSMAAGGSGVVVLTVRRDDDPAPDIVEDQDQGVTVLRLPFILGSDWSKPHPAIASRENVAAYAAFAPALLFGMCVSSVIADVCRRFQIDAIEFPDTNAMAWPTLAARRAGLLPGLPPIITHVHSPTRWIERFNREVEPGRRALLQEQMEAEQAAWSDGIVCPSSDMSRIAERLWALPRGTIRTIPYALGRLEPIAQRSADDPGARDDRAGPLRAVFVGRLEPRKGIDTLLAAFAIAADQEPGIELDVVGADITDRRTMSPFGARSLELLVPPGVRSRVRLLGLKDPAQVEALRDAADCAVVPSPHDNFPFTCIEAMAQGPLVIAAASGGMAEMIRDGQDGVLFEAGDAASLAAALRCAARMTADERRAMGASAAARILELCGTEAVLRARLEHMRSVIQSAAASHARREPDADILVLSWASEAPPDEAARLLRTALMHEPDADFAHGWPMDDTGALIAHGTPDLAGLLTAPRRIGPIAVRRRVLSDPRVAGLVDVSVSHAPESSPARPSEARSWHGVEASCEPESSPARPSEARSWHGVEASSAPESSPARPSGARSWHGVEASHAPEPWLLAVRLAAAGFRGMVVPAAHGPAERACTVDPGITPPAHVISRLAPRLVSSNADSPQRIALSPRTVEAPLPRGMNPSLPLPTAEPVVTNRFTTLGGH